MGPLISTVAAKALMDEQDRLAAAGARGLLGCERNGAFVTPGIWDVTAVEKHGDDEIFGPLLQLIRVADFDAAIEEANQTRFGLAAGLLSDDPARYAQFLKRTRAGVVNWNRQLTGASSAAPFGGVGNSGNHRPSAYFAADYCAYPIASLEVDTLSMPELPVPGLNDERD
jgi:succinylglutamic semialdehyde dehydrogenase